MEKAVAIRHVNFEDLGSFGTLLSKHYTVQYIEATDPDLSLLKNSNIDLLVVLGGPIGVYQELEYPFIKIEIDLLTERLKNNLPTLGICLGSQLMARALGSKVYPNYTKEIGWHPLTLTEKGKDNFISPLSSEFTSMFHWHGDTFDLPEGADLLASTSICKNQIFAWKKHGLAFQCHPEVTAQNLENWWIGHSAELSYNHLSVNQLRDQSHLLAPKLQEQALKMLEKWLGSINRP